jgi:hypothetical protein
MLKATYVSVYKKEKKDGVKKPVFVYALSGSQELVDRFVSVKTAEGYNPVDEATGRVLFFSPRSLGEGTVSVDLTVNNNIVPADASLVHMESQIGTIDDPTLKSAVANKLADIVLAKFGFGAPAAQVVQAPATAESKLDITE